MDWGDTEYPLVPGHEIIGVICAVGKNVKNFEIGNRVGWGVFAEYCKTCEMCTSGNTNICPMRSGTYGPRFGGYNTHFQGTERWCFKIGKNLWNP